jgi:hypothetical protein
MGRTQTPSNRTGEDCTQSARFVMGMRLGLGPALPTFVLGVTFGAAALAAEWGFGVPLSFSMLAFSVRGSSRC